MNAELINKLIQSLVLPVMRVLLLAYLGLALLLYFNQAHLVFVPSKTVFSTPKALDLNYEAVKLQVANLQISAWFIPASDRTIGKGVILFCHGNGGNIGNRLEYLSIFHSLGFAVFMFDYQGYGDSEGTPTEAGTYADGEAAWQYLTVERQIPRQKIAIYGESLGGAIAAYLATQHQPGALILASTFTAITDRAAELYPYLPVRLLSRFSYNTLARLPQVKSPTLVIHSPDDEIIPFHHGKALFQAANEPKSFLKLNGSHNGGFLSSEKIYRAEIGQFLDRHL